MKKLCFGSIAVLLGSIASIQLFTPSSSLAQGKCQCTNYVANRFNLTGFPDAADWNDGFLQKRGFIQLDSPKPGAIVVMERSFRGADSSFGHVGIVEEVKADNTITVRGANQYMGSPFFSEKGCSNVRVTPFGTSVKGRSDISFWSLNFGVQL
ncbi:CHAP domain-containing protein [Ancylothrix sp. C2]|uniref:CHAP domain-containing protein n=1 Tax=Ancylothrix sp. D3o TaxID=2953691 RepID=UPI0021BAC995|nr:CHAP domain-containing protein [Ancylothrix sp. D3o]MCT7952197.1 CHAP domain-containing protein [Ancylothrix sp. D3o]